MIKRAIFFGLLGTLILLGIYFTALTLVSGWVFTKQQFFTYWYFVTALAAGFGIQVGLYIYLKTVIKNQANKKMIVVSGTTSTVAMISCCSHYLVNLLPIIGIAGLITIISQYQIQLFWVGIIVNLIGIIYMATRLRSAMQNFGEAKKEVRK